MKSKIKIKQKYINIIKTGFKQIMIENEITLKL
jgi:hypothetical protein